MDWEIFFDQINFESKSGGLKTKTTPKKASSFLTLWTMDGAL